MLSAGGADRGPSGPGRERGAGDGGREEPVRGVDAVCEVFLEEVRGYKPEAENRMEKEKRGHIYIIQFKNALIKIGKSIDPCTRAQNIMQELGANGDDGYRIKQMLMTEDVDDVDDKESEIHRYMKNCVSKPAMRKEYYDTTIEVACEVVKKICNNREFKKVYPKGKETVSAKTVRVTFIIKRELAESLKMYAEIKETTMTELMSDYIESLITENQGKIERYKEGMQKLRESFE